MKTPEEQDQQLIEDMEEALNEYIAAGDIWRHASIQLLTNKLSRTFPDGCRADITAIVDENHTEHSVRVYDADGNEIIAAQDYPDAFEEGAENWWMEATEGAVFGCGERNTIVLNYRSLETP